MSSFSALCLVRHWMQVYVTAYGAFGRGSHIFYLKVDSDPHGVHTWNLGMMRGLCIWQLLFGVLPEVYAAWLDSGYCSCVSLRQPLVRYLCCLRSTRMRLDSEYNACVRLRRLGNISQIFYV